MVREDLLHLILGVLSGFCYSSVTWYIILVFIYSNKAQKYEIKELNEGIMIVFVNTNWSSEK